MKLSDTYDCAYRTEKDFIEHFFCSCPVVTPVWKDVEQQLAVQLGQHTPLSDRQKLFGLCKAEFPGLLIEKMNQIIMVAKMCISKFKYGDHNNIIWLFNYELSLRNLHW